jgi:hypothetical protein
MDSGTIIIILNAIYVLQDVLDAITNNQISVSFVKKICIFLMVLAIYYAQKIITKTNFKIFVLNVMKHVGKIHIKKKLNLNKNHY